MEKLTAISNLTTHTKKSFFGIVAIAILLIAALGAGYYFRFKNNQSYFKKYGLEILDSYHNRIERQLNNEILRALSIPDTTAASKKNRSPYKRDSIVNQAIEKLYGQISLDNGFLGKPFSEFVITTIAKSDNATGRKSIKTKNSLFLGDDFDYDALLVKDSLNNGLVKTYTASGADYLLFGRKYQFEYISDDSYGCEVVLFGLVDGKTYNKATRELDPWVIAMLLTFLLISLFGLPFFKMIFISSDERVFSRDVIAAGFAVVVGASLVIVIFMSLMEYAYKKNVTLPNDLQQIGKELSDRFTHENNANVEALYKVELEGYKSNEFDSIKPEDSHLVEHFKFIITINDSGKIKKKINLIKEPPEFPTNIKDREYVQDFKNSKNIWQTYVKENTLVEYVMRPVVSLESREEEAIYMIEDKSSNHKVNCTKDHKSEDCEYRVASAQLSSIHLPVMPFGFEYAIIDDSKNGDVWFHSQPGKSTLEEFFKVSRDANDIRAAIYARVEADGRLIYHGSKFVYFIMPIQGTNLNVIVLYDLALLRLQTSEVLSITGMAISISFISIGLLFLLTVILKGRRSRLYKEEKFIFDFLMPKKACKDRYVFLTLSFSVLFLLCGAFGLLQDFRPASAFITGFLLIIWSFVLVYYVLYPHGGKNFMFLLNNVFFVITIVVLNIVLWKEGSEGPDKIGKYVSALFLQGFCLALIIFSQKKLGYNQLADAVGPEPESLNSKNSKTKNYVEHIQSLFEKFPFSLAHRYSLFLFSWLMAAALLPAIIFYAKTEKINELIWVKTDQIYMSRAYSNKLGKLKKIIPPIKDDYLTAEYTKVYQKHLDCGKYIDKRYSITNRPQSVDQNKTDTLYNENLFRKLLWSSRPIFNEKIRNYKGMVYETASDFSWSSEERQKQIQLTTSNINSRDDEILSVWAGIQSPPMYRKNMHYYLLIVRFFGIITLLCILYSLVHFYTNRFYGFRFRHLRPINFDTDRTVDFAGEFGKMLSFKNSNSGLLLIGLPFSGKRNFSEKILEACDQLVGAKEASEKLNVNETDERTAYLSFLRLDETKKEEDIEAILNSLSTTALFVKRKENWDARHWKHAEYFIIENLEHGLRSFELNKMKLKVISYLIARKKRVIINSEVYPNQVLAIYKPLLKRWTGQDENNLISDYNSWRNIFGAFPQILIGMTDQRKQVIKSLSEMTDQKKQVVESLDKRNEHNQNVEDIADEVGYSQFLPKLAPVVMAKYKEAHFDTQSMILHVQKLSHGYYTDIWNALPSRERYMLYDLSKDGFMNIKNGNSLFSLMKKGLVVWRDRPTVFNQSFQNFIISFVSKKEALQMEQRNRKDSSWGTIKIVVYLMILTLVVFILLGEPGLLEDFEELLAAVGGLGVILPIISTILGKSGEK